MGHLSDSDDSDISSVSSPRKHKQRKAMKKSLKTVRYCKVPKFLDARKLCCNLPKIQTKRPNLREFRQKDTNGIANSEDPDQTAPLGAV